MACRTDPPPPPPQGRGVTPEHRAIDFLVREVPSWHRDNGCYSCHNNGDGARALYAAFPTDPERIGSALQDTTSWLTSPARWDQNKGDPGFSDKRLAAIQFTQALAAALASGHARRHEALTPALRRVLQEQEQDGSWVIEPANAIASPATYGTHLATAVMYQVLQTAEDPDLVRAREAARQWLRSAPAGNVPDAAAVLLGLANEDFPRRTRLLDFLLDAQSSSGGWGPYPDAPAEVFDTALVVLALQGCEEAAAWPEVLREGRRFLIAEQWEDGGWPETTRPSGNISYAQQISTSGWATLALLATSDLEVPEK